MKTIKLSDKQKEVITLMRKGCLLSKSYVDSKHTIEDENEVTHTFDGRLIHGLEVKGLLYMSSYQLYKLTIDGKKIALN